MDANNNNNNKNNRWAAEAGIVVPTPIHISGGITRNNTNNNTSTPTPLASQCQTPLSFANYSSDSDKAEKGEPHSQQTQPQQTPQKVHTHHPITTQRDHFLATIGESLSVGLGLGSAVGIWACIHATLKTAIPTTPNHLNIHIANWLCGLLMGFLLAPLLEKSARLLLGKTGTGMVLAKPHHHGEGQSVSFSARMAEHCVTISTALVGVGLCKGIQMQYAPLRSSSLGFEYLVFVVGFTIHAFLRVVVYTLVAGHDYEAEIVECSWGKIPSVMFWEYVDHFRHPFVLVTVNVRDFLTFALYPYLLVLWIGYWEGSVDPAGRYVWVAEGLNIGFFFTFFSVLKEGSYLLARPVWSEDLPRHLHHTM